MRPAVRHTDPGWGVNRCVGLAPLARARARAMAATVTSSGAAEAISASGSGLEASGVAAVVPRSPPINRARREASSENQSILSSNVLEHGDGPAGGSGVVENAGAIRSHRVSISSTWSEGINKDTPPTRALLARKGDPAGLYLGPEASARQRFAARWRGRWCLRARGPV